MPGELCIGGDGVTLGYWNRPELTADRFIADPFSAVPGATLYRTGDRARWSNDGTLEHLGRLDFQVKIRGYRIEPGEIETAIARHPVIREAVVMAREDTPGDPRLVAYLVAENPPEDLVEQLRAQLRAALPEYMVPSAFVSLEALPLTANAKIDRKALPAPERSALQQIAYVVPRTSTEETLASIWAEVLTLDRVGIEDNFFDLGGHSLLAMQMVLAGAPGVFGRVPAARDLRRADHRWSEHKDRGASGARRDGVAQREDRAVTISTLLTDLGLRGVEVWAAGDRLQLNAPNGVLTAELREELRQRKTEIMAFLRGPAELSFSQQRLWFLDQMEMASTTYVMPYSLRFEGSLQTGALEGALASIMARHESLRTTFADIEGRPVQIVTPVALFSLPVVKVSAEPERLDALMSEEIQRGFDLARGPLFRAVLYRLGPEEHVLLLLQHHIISDAWSVEVMLRELGILYRDRVSGRESTLPELPLQYRDFSRWQRGWLKGEALTHQLDYWRSHLAGAPQVLELPTDRPRPPMESHRGANHPFSIPREMVERLHALSRREGASLFMVLMAAFDVLLWRYTGQEDLLVGIPVANRGRTELEGLIGLFVNTLVVRNDLSGNPTVQELLARVRERCLNAYEHQELPLETLVEDMHPARDLSRNPLFQVMLVLQNAPEQFFTMPGLSLSPLEVDRGAAQLDLTLWVWESPEGLNGSFEYATDLFERSTIQRMAGHWRALLEAMVAAPERRISELPLLTDTERHQLVLEWNATPRDYPRNAVMQGLFEVQAARTPERVAVKVGSTGFSYAELEGRANRLAQALRARGVSRGQRVCLCLERGAEMLAAVLGIVKAGAAYVPLDPAFPAERLRFMAEDAELTLLVSSSRLAEPFGLPRDRQLLLDTDAAALAAQSDQRLTPDAVLDARPEDPAYVIYTSGSTGKPKGVVVPHRAVVNFLSSMAREPGLTADDVLVAVTTLSFDIAVLELQLPLTLGATVVIASREQAVDGRALGALLEQHHASVMQATPVTWRLLLAAGWKPGRGFKALVGGEALPRDLAEQLLERGVELWNLYGPTETTVWSTCARITDTANGISIGKPIANTTVYILDAQKDLCPIGVPGELCIGGDGVTLGYWNRPELTADRFIADPFSAVPGATLYRTGDRARWSNDGTLEHLGRLDFQVKIRGYRIEPGEIETAIARHPVIREAVVMAREDTPGDPRLVAYLVAENPPEDLVEQLRAQLRAALPEYMVPSAFVSLEALPLTANAKIDRKALPAPQANDRAIISSHEYAGPRNDLEISVAAAWEKVLGVQRVGITDNFFELGGNSLSMMRLIFEMEQATGIDISLGDILSYPTISGLMTRLGAEGRRDASVVVPLQPEGDEPPIFCICGINIYREFAQSVGKVQPVFGVYVEEEQAINNQIAKGGKPTISIERLVDAYFNALARVRPHGPYRLAGLSFGGILAMELASRLRAHGEQVDLVILFDTMLPLGLRRNWFKWFYYNTMDIMTGRAGATLRRLYIWFRDRFIKQPLNHVQNVRATYIDDPFSARQGAEFFSASRHWKGHGAIIDFPVLLFHASDHSDSGRHIEFDEDYGWRHYVGDRLSIVKVAGGHLDILELPKVSELGRETRRVLGLSAK